MAHHQEPIDHHQVPQDDSDYSSGNEDALADIIEAEANERFASLQAPEIAHQIPQELYEKAMKENDQLTDDERRILLSRGDVIGKALAHSASLTPEERNFVLGRPAPDQVRASIERVTDGQLHTVEELLAKARDDFDGLSEAEIHLVSQSFADDPGYGFFHAPRGPGSAEAGLLIEGVDARSVSHRVFLRYVALKQATIKTQRAEWESRQQAEWKKRLEEQKVQMMRGDIWKEYNQKIDEIKREAEASGWPEDERMRRNFIAAEWLQIKQERSDKGLKATDDSEDAKDWSDRMRENVALSFYRDETYDERARLQRENAPGVFSRYAEDLLTKWWDAMSKEERAVYLAKAGDIEQW